MLRVQSPILYGILTNTEGQFYLVIIINVDKVDTKEGKWGKAKWFARIYVSLYHTTLKPQLYNQFHCVCSKNLWTAASWEKWV